MLLIKRPIYKFVKTLVQNLLKLILNNSSINNQCKMYRKYGKDLQKHQRWIWRKEALI